MVLTIRVNRRRQPWGDLRAEIGPSLFRMLRTWLSRLRSLMRDDGSGCSMNCRTGTITEDLLDDSLQPSFGASAAKPACPKP
jgi:hypothetical protein